MSYRRQERQGFFLFHEDAAILSPLDSAQRGELLTALFAYSETGEALKTADPLVEMAFVLFSSKIRRQAEAYAEKCDHAAAKRRGMTLDEYRATIVKTGRHESTSVNNSRPVLTEVDITGTGTGTIKRTGTEPNRKKFIVPSVEEVRAYCKERGNTIDAEAFVDFYTSKGWKIGSQPMKDWKAAVRTWERGRRNQAPQKSQTVTPSLAEYDEPENWSIVGF